MSVNRSHFIIKKGDLEIEFEGDAQQVNAKFNEIVDWLKNALITNTQPPITHDTSNTIKDKAMNNKKGKQDKRGGSRSSVISPEIDRMVNNGFFDNFKKAEEVQEELRRNVISASDQAVNNALTRRVPQVLDRMQQDGIWVYRKKKNAG